jgi:L-alanine-DL-glutamate epimerase-like enolase superfamily enzyme
MKITRVEATSHRVPAKVPLLHEPVIRDIVFVRVDTDGGVAGYGLTGPIQRFAVRELINREIAPLLLGKDPLATERHWYDLFYRLNPRAQTGRAARPWANAKRRGAQRDAGAVVTPARSRHRLIWFPMRKSFNCVSSLNAS